MNKKVSVKISGLHQMGEADSEDKIEVINIGSYYKRSGKHFIKYEEPVEKSDKVNSSLLKVSDDEIELLTKGENSAHMVFTRGKKNTLFYSTPFGGLNMGIDTYSLVVEEEENKIAIDVRYSLEINLDYIADCRVSIEIESIGM